MIERAKSRRVRTRRCTVLFYIGGLTIRANSWLEAAETYIHCKRALRALGAAA